MTLASDTLPSAGNAGSPVQPAANDPVVLTPVLTPALTSALTSVLTSVLMPVLTPVPTPKPARSTKTCRKAPRRPLHITPRKPDGLLMYARRIPKDVLAMRLYPTTTTTIRVGLGTRDWLAAQPKATQLTAQLERFWAEARDRQEPPVVPTTTFNPRRLRADDIPVLGKRLEALLLHCDDVDRDKTLSEAELNQYLEEFEDQQKALRRSGLRSDAASMEEEATGFLDAEGLECDHKTSEWQVWLKTVLQAHLSALGTIAARLDCRPQPTPEPPPSIRGETDLDDLDRALTYWVSKASPELKTISEMQAVLERFKVTTERTRVSAVRPADIVLFLAAERVRDSARGGKVNVQTANKGIALLKAMFSVVHTDCLKHYGIANPLADAGKFKVKARDKSRRKAFSQAQLDILFSGPLHTQGDRPRGGAGEAAYWIPILGYCTGARMGELLQLRVADVVELDGVLFLRTDTCDDEDDEGDEGDVGNEGDGGDEGDDAGEGGEGGEGAGTVEIGKDTPRLTLKTEESYRLIPLHGDVLALGFLAYIEWVRAAGHVQLFPNVRIGANQSWSANFSRFFNRYLRQLRIKARLLDFISFRHMFKTSTRSLRMQQDIADYIQGHARERASQGYGEIPADVLHESINAMSFPALRLCQPWSPPLRPSLRSHAVAAGPKRS